MLCLYSYISKTEKITNNTPAWYAYKTFIKINTYFIIKNLKLYCPKIMI